MLLKSLVSKDQDKMMIDNYSRLVTFDNILKSWVNRFTNQLASKRFHT